ncbi:MAG: YebC/PmpR family DNA-binding transcriptional regulator [Candidatus Melainabacteria bacterium]|jgi:YebC/PmpR family DNA-binding regulatory protein|nr:YebC/PmpR family DNA-binding transcriptional regulator [Candidatus Melainabacteria bacterium]
MMMMMGRWMAIKNKKASSDAKKGVALAKYSMEIIKATKLGGLDISANFRLRTAIEKAKLGGLSKDSIENALLKGSGQLKSDNVEEVTYEGYGPGGVAIFIETTTENRNRTAGDIRSYFNKFEGNFGQDGCVAYLFAQKGQIIASYPASLSFDDVFELAVEAGAEDIQPDETFPESKVVIYTAYEELNAVCQAITTSSTVLKIEEAEITRIPATQAEVTTVEVGKPLYKLLAQLENHDDVQQVYCNATVDDELTATLEAML